MTHDEERNRRWRLALGINDAEDEKALSASDMRLSRALGALYNDSPGLKGHGGLGASAPSVARWLGDIRSYFPAPVVQVIQKDAFERKGLRQMLLEPEFLGTVEADIHLVADLMALRGVIPDKAKEAARAVISKVVAELMERLEQRTADAIRGSVDRTRRTRRPRFANIDWPRTIQANLRHYQAGHRSIVPERLVGFLNHQHRADLDEVVLCVDQSGSMATSVIYASIFAAVMASLPGIVTRLVCFDTAVIDLTEELSDPVEVLFGLQLGGGTDINRAVAYCAGEMVRPDKTHLVLITDLYEGGDAEDLLTRLAWLHGLGVNVIVLLALTDTGSPAYHPVMAGQVAALGIPVFACTPDLFPDMMAAALRREDMATWAAGHDIKAVAPNALRDTELPTG
ncbi:VWA domain-containing protein [Komagataeibacter rhaeticus]|uniref:vWA domain-containing protein n=1 Tax=Komagataeibacter rhaeticus TaxID=215221 RepID=UPI001A579AF2|nr:VWA domain-containing protein [Komagataeibacter rhaeticus]MBL7238865.1 VWA domain-containing protein [Komagataeibacter rhaeticus]